MGGTDASTIVGALMAVLSVLAVAARFYSRHAKGAGYKWDDWLILVSLLATIATDIVAICATTADPTGPIAASNVIPNYKYTPADVLYTKMSWASTLGYFLIASTIKLSILLMYNRLFYVDRAFRRMNLALCILVVCFWISCTVANLTNCIPMKYVWINSHSDPRYCFNFNIFWFASGICEAFIDVLIILLPMRVIAKLQFSTRQKLALASVFLMGTFVIASGLIKAILGYVPGNRQPSFGQTQLWTTVHSGTGIICACLPVCWPHISRLGHINVASWRRSSWMRKYRYRSSGWTPQEGLDSVEETPGKGYQLADNLGTGGFTVTFTEGIREEIREENRDDARSSNSQSRALVSPV